MIISHLFFFVFRQIGAVSNVWCEKFQDKFETDKQFVDICQEEFSQVSIFPSQPLLCKIHTNCIEMMLRLV